MTPARALLAAALGVCLAAGWARANVTGVVSTIQRPLSGAQVIALETGAMAVTDSLGRFDLGSFPPGVYSLRVVAIGYGTAGGTAVVGDDGASEPVRWLLKPLRPDGQGVTGGLAAPRRFTIPSSEAPAAGAAPGAAPAAAESARTAAPADSLASLPAPAPIAPVLTLYLSPEEQAARAGLPGPLGELLPRIATADSITAVSGGTSAPGEETWRQWSERIGAWATANPQDGRAPLARRSVAYTRTRLALAAGPTWTGYQDAKLARQAIGLSRLDVTTGAPGAAFLDSLGARLDSTFVPGSTPPKPAPAPRHRAKHRAKRRKPAS